MKQEDVKEFIQKAIKKRELFVSNLMFMRLDHNNKLKHIGGCNKKW